MTVYYDMQVVRRREGSPRIVVWAASAKTPFGKEYYVFRRTESHDEETSATELVSQHFTKDNAVRAAVLCGEAEQKLEDDDGH